MKVGDLVRITKDNWVVTSDYKGHQGRIALVVDGVAGHNETKVQMVHDGAVLWFLTKELEAVK
tara:strand:- start:253 stop:441 length:189 start_codon:yes stop_codon:yes gene_type:complete